MTNKIKIEKTKVNLKINKIQLFNKKNFLIAKKEKFRAKIATLNIINISIRNYQNPFLKSIQNKFKAKRPPSFDNLKKNFQKFFIKIQYYQKFYQ